MNNILKNDNMNELQLYKNNLDEDISEMIKIQKTEFWWKTSKIRRIYNFLKIK